MKRFFSSCLRAGLPILLGLFLAFGAIAPAFADEELTADTLHFGNPALNEYSSLSGAELLEQLCGISPSAVERAFLDGDPRYSLRYSSLIPSEGLSYHYDGEAGILKVSVLPYTYTAVNGASVSWIPQRASIQSESGSAPTQSKSLSRVGDAYVCTFENLFHSADFFINVDFSWRTTLAEWQLEELSDAAYTEGRAALDRLLVYESALSLHQSKVKDAETYAAYLKQVEDYAAYAVAKAEYDRAKAEYDAYCAEYAAYAEQLSRWQAWRDYYAANSFYTEKDASGKTAYDRYLEYRAFLDSLEPIKQKLAILDYLFVTDSHNWQIYSAVMGNTVTQVLARKDELAILNLDKAVEQAANATTALRPLFSAYNELRSASYPSEVERYRTLYAFYTEHYLALRDNVAALQSALELMCKDSGFLTALELYPDPSFRGHLPHLQNLVAQLYVLRTCLHDSLAQDPAWKLNKYRTLQTILEDVQHMADTHNADPRTAEPFPTGSPEPIEFVPPAERPSFADVKKPTEPTYVAEPTEPSRVEKPIEYGEQKPSWWGAVMPSLAPAAPEMSDTLRALAEEVRAGRLTAGRTEEFSGTLTLRQTKEYLVSIHNRMTVSFYGMNNQLLYRTQVEYGDEVIYQGPPLTVPETPQASYEFRGWRCADGSDPDFFCIRQNTSFYANFHAIPKVYAVTWQLGEYRHVTHHLYGETPTCPVSPEREDTPAMRYAFLGWDKELLPVTEDAVYTARYEEIPVRYTVTWDLGDRTESALYGYGETPVPPENPSRAPDECRYVFVGWNARPAEVTGDVTYKALYGEIKLAYTDDGTAVSVTHTDTCITLHAEHAAVRLDEAMRYALEDGKTLALSAGDVTVVLDADALSYLSQSGCKKLRLAKEVLAQGELVTLQALSSAGRVLELPELTGQLLPALSEEIRLDVAIGEERLPVTQTPYAFRGALSVYVRRVFSVQVESAENCDLNSLPVSAFAGDLVTLDPTCVFGYELVGITVLGEDGRVIDTEGCSFRMPAEPVTVRLQIAPIRYTVSFLVEGILWHTEEYGLGEEIRLPSEPTLPDDAEFRYVFTGWSPRVGVASGDERELTFTASFSKISLSEEDPYRGDMTGSNVFSLFLPLGIAFLLILVAVILLFCFRKRIRAWSKRKKASASAASKTTGEQNADAQADVTACQAPTEDEGKTVTKDEEKTDADAENGPSNE